MKERQQETITLAVGYKAFDKPIGKAFDIAAAVGDWSLTDRLHKMGKVNDQNSRRGRGKLTLDRQTYQSAIKDAIALAEQDGDAELVHALTKINESVIDGD